MASAVCAATEVPSMTDVAYPSTDVVVTTSPDSWANAVAVAVSVCVVLTAAAAAAGAGGPPPRRLHERVQHDGRDDVARGERRRARGEPAQHVHVGERLRLRRCQRDGEAQRLVGHSDEQTLAHSGPYEQLPDHREEFF